MRRRARPGRPQASSRPSASTGRLPPPCRQTRCAITNPVVEGPAAPERWLAEQRRHGLPGRVAAKAASVEEILTSSGPGAACAWSRRPSPATIGIRPALRRGQRRRSCRRLPRAAPRRHATGGRGVHRARRADRRRACHRPAEPSRQCGGLGRTTAEVPPAPHMFTGRRRDLREGGAFRGGAPTARAPDAGVTSSAHRRRTGGRAC